MYKSKILTIKNSFNPKVFDYKFTFSEYEKDLDIVNIFDFSSFARLITFFLINLSIIVLFLVFLF